MKYYYVAINAPVTGECLAFASLSQSAFFELKEKLAQEGYDLRGLKDSDTVENGGYFLAKKQKAGQ